MGACFDQIDERRARLESLRLPRCSYARSAHAGSIHESVEVGAIDSCFTRSIDHRSGLETSDEVLLQRSVLELAVCHGIASVLAEEKNNPALGRVASWDPLWRSPATCTTSAERSGGELIAALAFGVEDGRTILVGFDNGH